jgi:glutaredoxin
VGFLRVVLYRADGCGACEAAERLLGELAESHALDLHIVDIAGDPELEALHRVDLPVIEIGGRVAFTQAVDRRSLVRRLAQAPR